MRACQGGQRACAKGDYGQLRVCACALRRLRVDVCCRVPAACSTCGGGGRHGLSWTSRQSIVSRVMLVTVHGHAWWCLSRGFGGVVVGLRTAVAVCRGAWAAGCCLPHEGRAQGRGLAVTNGCSPNTLRARCPRCTTGARHGLEMVAARAEDNFNTLRGAWAVQTRGGGAGDVARADLPLGACHGGKRTATSLRRQPVAPQGDGASMPGCGGEGGGWLINGGGGGGGTGRGRPDVPAQGGGGSCRAARRALHRRRHRGAEAVGAPPACAARVAQHGLAGRALAPGGARVQVRSNEPPRPAPCRGLGRP